MVEEKDISEADDQTDAIDRISEVAGLRRKDAVESHSKQLPEVITSIDATEVHYTLVGRHLPFTLLQFKLFREILEEEYDVKFVRPDFSFVLPEKLKKMAVLPIDDEGEILLKQNEFKLIFQDGRFPIGRSDFIPINFIQLTKSSIKVNVQGVTRIADTIAQEVAEWIFFSAGFPKRWDQLKEAVRSVSYGTNTKVDFGFPLKSLLRSTVLSFISNRVLDGGYARHMGSFLSRDNFACSPECSSFLFNVNKIGMRFHRFDETTGSKEESTLILEVDNPEEEGTGICLVSSRLPLEKHVEMIQELKNSLLTESLSE